MKISRIHIVLVILLMPIGIPFAEAQQAIQVVSTTQKESYSWTDKSRLFINGEQATIELSTYGGTELKCEIVRASRHSNKEQAETDLKKLKLIADQSGKTISLRNYVELSGSDKRPESKLKTTYKIQIPINVKGSIEIWNYFGNITVEDISSDMKFKLEFTNLNLTNFSGIAEMKLKYGEINLKNISGIIDLTSNRTNITIENLTGSAEIDATYAELRILKISKALRFAVNADRSEIFLDIASKTLMNYEIKTQNSEVKNLSSKQLESVTDTDGSQKYHYKAAGNTANAVIQLNTGTLNYIVQ
ncbi:DUF4097 domain-containing protein [Cryomorpha ignava]|uniref:DUF4097 domain-containing protein n=1 Tax=Cryomorpha ignava TaxID=101383 RepID=A0A7K3WND9_9FLAO|nr:DUF4097 domain-containing protein [Cryomorpha ignava]NEN23167.1 DUF4097 domain-containing protein [Cryomorpha ignava]